jgi:hypothetical protein
MPDLPIGSPLRSAQAILGRRMVPEKDRRAEFNLVIRAKYAIIGENGLVSGTLDGIKTPLHLAVLGRSLARKDF